MSSRGCCYCCNDDNHGGAGDATTCHTTESRILCPKPHCLQEHRSLGSIWNRKEQIFISDFSEVGTVLVAFTYVLKFPISTIFRAFQQSFLSSRVSSRAHSHTAVLQCHLFSEEPHSISSTYVLSK